ncbi:30S ribosomal protein S5 [Candidatus Uhrbacteria bacterium]|nr:30S ribosomal protein S5 [Candidatus Uhrbacteria bacterium]
MAEGKRPRRDTRTAEEKEFDQRIIDIARVTRVMAGGKRMRFRACVVIGDHKGRMGYGLGKGADVTLAVQKGATRARRDLVTIPIEHETIPHELRVKYKAARLLIKPAPKGTGVMAGGAIRLALELSGIGNVVTKVYGSKNKINNIGALFVALRRLGQSVAKRSVLNAGKRRAQPKNKEKETETE